MSESHLPPVAGQDYPKTWSQFMDWFHSEQACLDYLERLRWPKEFICPSCGVVGMTNRVPTFAPAWKVLFYLFENDRNRDTYLAKALSLKIDADTYGISKN